MVVGVIGFDCNCVYGEAWWSQMYQLSPEIFDQIEVELILERKKKTKQGKEREGDGGGGV